MYPPNKDLGWSEETPVVHSCLNSKCSRVFVCVSSFPGCDQEGGKLTVVALPGDHQDLTPEQLQSRCLNAGLAQEMTGLSNLAIRY